MTIIMILNSSNHDNNSVCVPILDQKKGKTRQFKPQQQPKLFLPLGSLLMPVSAWMVLMVLFPCALSQNITALEYDLLMLDGKMDIEGCQISCDTNLTKSIQGCAIECATSEPSTNKNKNTPARRPRCSYGVNDGDMCCPTCGYFAAPRVIRDLNTTGGWLHVVHFPWLDPQSRYQTLFLGQCGTGGRCHGRCNLRFSSHKLLVSTSLIQTPIDLVNVPTWWQTVEIPDYCSCVSLACRNVPLVALFLVCAVQLLWQASSLV